MLERKRSGGQRVAYVLAGLLFAVAGLAVVTAVVGVAVRLAVWGLSPIFS